METNDIKLTVLKDAVCTSKYGVKRNIKCTNGKTVVDVHSGVDLVSKTGNKDLLAVADGKVIYLTHNDGTGAKTIVTAYHNILPFGFVLLVLYTHCDSFSVKNGQAIKKGQKIATLGATGNVSAAHVHVSTYYIPPLTWKDKNGKYYTWNYKTRDQFEIDPNLLLHVY